VPRQTGATRVRGAASRHERSMTALAPARWRRRPPVPSGLEASRCQPAGLLNFSRWRWSCSVHFPVAMLTKASPAQRGCRLQKQEDGHLVCERGSGRLGAKGTGGRLRQRAQARTVPTHDARNSGEAPAKHTELHPKEKCFLPPETSTIKEARSRASRHYVPASRQPTHNGTFRPAAAVGTKINAAGHQMQHPYQ